MCAMLGSLPATASDLQRVIGEMPAPEWSFALLGQERLQTECLKEAREGEAAGESKQELYHPLQCN